MSLYQPFKMVRDIPCSGTGYFAHGGKVTKTPPGFPRTPFCPIGHYRGRYRAATEFLQGRWPPRNRCSGYPTSPDGPRAESFYNFLLSETSLLSKEAGSRTRKNQLPLPLQKGDSRSWMRNPPQIRCPKDSVVQWQRSGKFYPDRLGKKTGGLGSPQRFFRPLLGVQKWARRRQNSAEGHCWPLRKPRVLGPGRPQQQEPRFGSGTIACWSRSAAPCYVSLPPWV